MVLSGGPVERGRPIRLGLIDLDVFLQQHTDRRGLAGFDGVNERQVGGHGPGANRERDRHEESGEGLRQHAADYHKINRMLKIPNFEYSLEKTVSLSIVAACAVGVLAT